MAVAWALNVWATNSWVGMNGGPPNAWRGASTPTPVVVVTSNAGGVGKGRRGRTGKREVVVRLAEADATTAEFLKSQLRLRHPESAFTADAPAAPAESRAARMARQRIEAETARAMEVEAAEQEQKRTAKRNNALRAILLLGSD